MSSFILATWSTTQIAQWIHTNLTCIDYGNLMLGMYAVPTLEDILLTGPYLFSIYTGNYTQQQLIDALLAAAGTADIWQLMYLNSAPGYLLEMVYLNDMASFYAQLNKTYWMLIGPQQQAQQPYTRTQYYSYIQAHFSSNTYQQLVDMFIHLSNQYSDKFVVNEWHIYGSSRIGTQKINRQLVQVVFNGTWNSYEGNFGTETNQVVTFYEADLTHTALARGNKRYELTNHLGNVLVVISDKKLPYCTEGTADYYTAEVLQATDYSAFGVILKDREYYATTTDKYRYGFNGKEEDDETQTQDYGFRIYNPRLGRFLSIDPLSKEFPWNSPYSFAENDVIRCIDMEGLEKVQTTFTFVNDKPRVKLVGADLITINAKAPREEIFKIQLATKIYTTNSFKTLHGRDDGVDKIGDFSGVTSLSKDDVTRILAYASHIIYDKYNGNVERATLKESNALPGSGKALDFKWKAYELLNIDRNQLLEINGVAYNANEAGNYLWGLALEYHGSFISPNGFAEAGSKTQGRSDEPHEQKAITAGRAFALKLRGSKDFKQFEELLLQYRLDYRSNKDEE